MSGKRREKMIKTEQKSVNDGRITFKLPKQVKDEFLKLAKVRCINVSQVLRVFVDDFIKENQNPK